MCMYGGIITLVLVAHGEDDRSSTHRRNFNHKCEFNYHDKFLIKIYDFEDIFVFLAFL